MGWLEQHHTGVVRTATGVVLVAGAVTGVVSHMAFDNLAADNAQKQHQIDALAHQLQEQGITPSASASPGAAPLSGSTLGPAASPGPTTTVLLLAGGSPEPVVNAQGGHGGSQGGSGGSTAAPGSSGTPGPSPSASGPLPGPSPTHASPSPRPSTVPSTTPSQQPVITGLLTTVSGTLNAVVAPLHKHPSHKPSQAPLTVLYLFPAARRHP